MGLKSKLLDWVEDGLITAVQSESIQRFEQQRLSSKLQNGLKYSGFFAILLGIALIVASNWDAFGVHLKLIAHFFMNAVLAGLIWIWRDNAQRRLWREIAVYFLCGLTLTLLALIGQSFQLQGDIGDLLLIWLGLITGLVIILGQNTRIVTLWFVGFFVTIYYNIGKLVDIGPEHVVFFVLLFLSLIAPLGGYLLGTMQKFKDLNPVFAMRLQNVALASSIVMAGISSLFFYTNDIERGIVRDIGQAKYYLWLIEIFIFYSVVGLLIATTRKQDETVLAILLSGVFTFIPLFLLMDIHLLSAVHFIAFMVGLSYLAAKGGHETMMGLCMFAVSIRIFIVFIELFGSMFATGGGLILAGLLLLGILKGTNVIRKKIIGGAHAQ